MKRKTLYVILFFVMLFIIGGSIGLYMYNKPVKNFAESEAEITLTSKDLFNAFTNDQAQASSKYVSEDKTIQIKGKILDITQNAEGITNILIDVADPEGDISCTLIKEEAQKAKKYKAGNMITLKGQCTGYQELINKEVILIGCGIVE